MVVTLAIGFELVCACLKVYGRSVVERIRHKFMMRVNKIISLGHFQIMKSSQLSTSVLDILLAQQNPGPFILFPRLMGSIKGNKLDD